MSPAKPSAAPSARRIAYLLPVLLITLAAGVLGVGVTGAPPTPFEALLLGLFIFNTGWLALSSWQVVLGFVLHCLGRRAATPLERDLADIDPAPSGRSRTAVLVPVCDEDPDAVFARVAVMARALGRDGVVFDVDLFVLSDTRDPKIAAAEAAAYEALVEGNVCGRALPAVYYRRRADNAGRKAGNIADFCARFGHGYDFMVVLDADSLMAAGTIRRLARLMEITPRAGVIQTVPYQTNRETLFARVKQFAARLYTPVSVRGLDFWQQGDGNYWGHNAILRVRAFMEHCDLPVLPGKRPLGGELLCHDIVEAGMLHRAGWEVRVVPELEGSWEEMPANTIDFAGRDRRWGQGNLQHMRVMVGPGLRFASRLHLAIGVGVYATAPAWVGAFALSMAHHAGAGPETGAIPGLRPDDAAAVLLCLTLGLLLVPKILGVVRALGDPAIRRSYGGAARLLTSAVLEQAFAMLLAPMLLVFYTRFVLSTLAGRVVSWDAQPRGDRAVGLREAARRHAGHVALGLGVASAALALDPAPAFLGWALFLSTGLVLSPFVTALSSRVGLGRAARRLGLFLTADETFPADELVDLRARLGSPAGDRATPARAAARRVPPPRRAPASRSVADTAGAE